MDAGALEFDGWRIIASRDHARISDLWFSGPSDGWATSSAGGILHYDGVEWALVPQRAPGVGMRATMGSGPSDVWFLGEHDGVIGHWDGHALAFDNFEPSLADAGSLTGDDLWVRGADDVWVIGRRYGPVGMFPDEVIHHRTDAGWSSLSPPADLYYSTLAGSSTEVWIIGGTRSGMTVSGGLWRWNGSSFSLVTAPGNFVPSRAWLLDVNDVWMTNYTGLRRWNGSQLSTTETLPGMTPSGPPQSYALWGTGSDVWAAGQGLFRRVGSSWQPTPSFLEVDILTSLWGTAPDDVWACGFDSVSEGACARFDGQAWTPRLAASLHEVSSAAPLADGSLLFGVGDGTMLRANGGVTERFPALPLHAPNPRGGVRGLWGSSTADLFAIEGSSVSGPSHAAVYRFIGGAWVAQYTHPSAQSWSLNGIWGAGPNELWAVGGSVIPGSRLVLRFDGMTWAPVNVTSSASVDLTAIWGASSTAVWAVGSTMTGGAVILRWGGSAWADAAIPAGGLALSSISGTSATDVWAGGKGGTLFHLDANGWSRVTTPFVDDIRAVVATGSELWVAAVDPAGLQTTFWRYSASTWQRGATIPFAALQLTVQNGRVWATGEDGLIAHAR